MRSVKKWVKRKIITSIEASTPQSLIDRLIKRYSVPSVNWSLRNVKKNGFSPEVIVDVGAYVGEWTKMVRQIYPESYVLAVEPQREKRENLRALAASDDRIRYEDALLGAVEDEEVSFHINETVSSVLPEQESEAPEKETRSLETLDRLVEDTPFEEPDLTKLDVQGYELEVLRGAEKTLESCPPELILTEVSLIDINQGAPLFHEVTEFMDERNYRLYDICSFMRRPYDDALWQVDALFVHSASDLIASREWE